MAYKVLHRKVVDKIFKNHIFKYIYFKYITIFWKVSNSKFLVTAGSTIRSLLLLLLSDYRFSKKIKINTNIHCKPSVKLIMQFSLKKVSCISPGSLEKDVELCTVWPIYSIGISVKSSNSTDVRSRLTESYIINFVTKHKFI